MSWTVSSSNLKLLIAVEREKRRRQSAQVAEKTGWHTLARPEQLPPSGDWLVWYVQAGRGWGKTRTGAEYTWQQAQHCPRLAIVAPTFGDGRDYCIEGESGLKALHPELDWNRSLGEMTFPSGAKGKLFSAEEPDRLRGPNNYFAWCDEIASWRHLKRTWDMLAFTMRKGAPRWIVTATPKPYPFLKELKARSSTVLVRGRTYDNLANLADAYIEQIIKPYEGTDLGRQELDAEDLDDVQGALWTSALIESLRVTKAPPLTRVVTAVDPSATETGDEAGIITAGLGLCDCKGPDKLELHGFVLSDDSVQAAPEKWAANGVTAYHKFGADTLVAESNNGGQMVAVTIGTVDHAPPVKLIHASLGKQTRAQPISLLYQQRKVHHVGTFAQLESEQRTWVPGLPSPNRMDALVWALTDLMVGNAGAQQLLDFYRRQAQQQKEESHAA